MTAQPIETTDTVKTITPIAFWKTRSFWFGWFPAALTGLDTLMQIADTPAAVPVANSMAMILNVFGVDQTGEEIALFMKGLAPLYALIVAWQRRGVNQPYSAGTAKEKELITVIHEGQAAFKQGKVLGGLLKR